MFTGWLMCTLRVLRPHFLCRYCDRKSTRSPPKPIASVVMGQCKKQEDKVFVWKVFEELSAIRHEKTFCFWQTFDFGQLIRVDNSSQTFGGNILIFALFRQWHIKTETWKWRLDNFSVSSDFFGLRAEVTLEKETPEFRKVQVRAEVKLLNFVEDDFYEFWLNSVAILSEFCFERIFTIIC